MKDVTIPDERVSERVRGGRTTNRLLTEIVTTAFQRPPKIGIGACIGVDYCTIREDYLTWSWYHVLVPWSENITSKLTTLSQTKP